MHNDVSRLSRRSVLSGAVAGAAGLALARGQARAADADATRLVDSNVSLFQWPFRRLRGDDPAALAMQLDRLGVSEAWAGSFEALLHRDIDGVNRRLAEAWAGSFEALLHRDIDGVNRRLARACREAGRGRLVPMGAVNPMLPDWEEDLRRCAELYAMPGIRLHPNYHGYGLEDRKFHRLLELATRRGLLVQLSVAMEDARTQHPLVRVPEVDLKPLPALLKTMKDAKVQLLNWRPRPADLEALGAVDGLHVDIARVEDTAGVARLLRALPAGRVLFGSHAPFLIQEAAMIRCWEGDLTGEELDALCHANADRLLERRPR